MNADDHIDRSDPLRSTLHALGGDIELDAASPSAIVASGRSRLHRRRVLAGGATAVVVLVGVVAVTRNDDDSVRTSETTATTSPVSTPDSPPATTTPLVTAPIESAAPESAPPASAPPASAPAQPAAGNPGDDVEGVWAEPAGTGQLAPWRDGFVSISTEYAPQPLPDRLPDEVLDLFPPAVIELFSEGLPANMDEAVEMLRDAELLDEVNQVLADHPEAAEAITSEDAPPPRTLASFTTDGVNWRQTQLPTALPYPEVAIIDGEVVVWSIIEEPVDPTEPNARPLRATVLSSADLSTWRSADIDLDASSSESPLVVAQRWIDDVTVVGDRWFALATTDTQVDFESLLPDDLRRELNEAPSGWEMSSEADGITVAYVDAAGERVVRSFTFAELGLSGDPSDTIARQPSPTLLVGSFDGASQESVAVPDDAVDVGALTTWGDRLVYVTDQVYVSDDALTWTAIADVPAQLDVDSVVPVDDALMLVGYDGDGGAAALRLSPAGELDDVRMPTLPGPFGLWGNRSSAAWVVQLESADMISPPVEFSFEHEGMRFEISDRNDAMDVVITDAATGEVVLDRLIEGADRDGIFVAAPDSGEPIVAFVDPESGTTIASVPVDVFSEAYAGATPVDAPAIEGPPPDMWLIATVDGSNWITRDIPEPGPNASSWPTVAAISGNGLLYATSDGWVFEQH